MLADKFSVLIADDSRITRSLVKGILGDIGEFINFHEAESGDEALKMLNEQHLDMAFLDIDMPGMTGLAAIGHARHHGSRVFTVIMSATITEKRRALASSLGAYDFLEKPLNIASVQHAFQAYKRICNYKTVLIVDDSRTARQAIASILQKTSFNVLLEEAENAESALRKCRSGHFDIVFLDVLMPQLSGMEAIKFIRQSSPKSKIVMISGSPTPEMVKEALQFGVQGFLAKPFNAGQAGELLKKLYS
ncbi:MAG: response regulator transcription factor [Alphaproteobacteria bacterium]